MNRGCLGRLESASVSKRVKIKETEGKRTRLRKYIRLQHCSMRRSGRVGGPWLYALAGEVLPTLTPHGVLLGTIMHCLPCEGLLCGRVSVNCTPLDLGEQGRTVQTVIAFKQEILKFPRDFKSKKRKQENGKNEKSDHSFPDTRVCGLTRSELIFGEIPSRVSTRK
jgi:hypothetical protein